MPTELINRTVAAIAPPDEDLMRWAQMHLNSLTKPQGSLGRLEELARRIVGISRRRRPELKRKVIFTMAADHGIVAEGVSAFPQEVTPQMVFNFLRGGAGVNVLASHAGAEVVVVDMGVAHTFALTEPEADRFRDRKIAFGTANFARGPAMTRQQARQAVETGIELVAEESAAGLDIVGTGDMGIGNTSASTAVTAVLTGLSVDELTGRGTGLDDAAVRKKADAIRRGIGINRPDPHDPLDVLANVGGFEIGGLAGVMLGAAARRIPVVVDGFIATAAYTLAVNFAPALKDCVIFSHHSAEKGHAALLKHLDQQPLLSLGMRLGEGTGAALAISLCEAAVRIFNEMATFQSAAVSERTS